MNSKVYWRLTYIFCFLAVALMFVTYRGYIAALPFGAVSLFMGMVYCPMKAKRLW